MAIINSFLTYGTVPSSLKVAAITPILKKPGLKKPSAPSLTYLSCLKFWKTSHPLQSALPNLSIWMPHSSLY